MSFVWDTEVFFDELDLMGYLHNARFALHLERAQSAYFETLGLGWTDFAERDPDLNYAVRQMTLDLLVPVAGPGPLRVEVLGERIGSSSATYGYRFARGEVLHATATRLIVHLDPQTMLPSPWSETYREQFARL